MLRCENSIISDVSESVGIILPLQVGHVAPHPSPDPVALTNAPARIESTKGVILVLCKKVVSQ